MRILGWIAALAIVAGCGNGDSEPPPSDSEGAGEVEQGTDEDGQETGPESQGVEVDDSTSKETLSTTRSEPDGEGGEARRQDTWNLYDEVFPGLPGKCPDGERIPGISDVQLNDEALIDEFGHIRVWVYTGDVNLTTETDEEKVMQPRFRVYDTLTEKQGPFAAFQPEEVEADDEGRMLCVGSVDVD